MDIQQTFVNDAMNRLTKSPFVQQQGRNATPPETNNYIVTESGSRITTESGDRLITEDS